MRAFLVHVLVLAATIGIVQTAAGQAVRVTNTVVQHTGTVTVTRTVAGPGMPSRLDVVVVGKVAEIEPDVVEVAPFKGARKEQMIRYRVANLKIDDRVLGASGVTRIRVGWVDRAGGGLTPDMDGCFSLARQPNTDFYVLVSQPIQKKNANYAKEVDRLKKYAKAIDDPVAALKAKDLTDRFEAAQVILQRYRTPQGSTAREPVPDEENKLILALLAELPWVPADGQRVRADGRMVPHRSALWYAINPGELGFKQPPFPKRQPGDPPPDFNKVMDEATAKFLKENGNKVQLKRFKQK